MDHLLTHRTRCTRDSQQYLLHLETGDQLTNHLGGIDIDSLDHGLPQIVTIIHKGYREKFLALIQGKL
ncbi:hypothetical protein D3C84_944360 [compost metagenome]